MKQQLNEFLKQRGQQRDYDDLHDLHQELLKLDETDKTMVKGIVEFAKEEAQARVKIKEEEKK